MKEPQDGQFVVGDVYENINDPIPTYINKLGVYWKGKVYEVMIIKKLRAFKIIPLNRVFEYVKFVSGGVFDIAPTSGKTRILKWGYGKYLPLITRVPENMMYSQRGMVFSIKLA